MADRTWITMTSPTSLIFRYHLPLKKQRRPTAVPCWVFFLHAWGCRRTLFPRRVSCALMAEEGDGFTKPLYQALEHGKFAAAWHLWKTPSWFFRIYPTKLLYLCLVRCTRSGPYKTKDAGLTSIVCQLPNHVILFLASKWLRNLLSRPMKKSKKAFKKVGPGTPYGEAVLRIWIRNVYPGPRIPDPYFHHGSRIQDPGSIRHRIPDTRHEIDKEFKYFLPKNFLLSSRPGC
jgi:hypothetical protein